MNEIVKNEYTEIQKYFDDYYKEQLKKYEELKYYDNYLFTNIEDEPIYWGLGLAVLGFIHLFAEISHEEIWNYIFFAALGLLILFTILIFFKAIFWNFEFKKSKKNFFKHYYKSKNIRTVTRYLGVNKSDLLFNEDYIIIGLNIKDEKQLNKIEREIKNGKQFSRAKV
jgi:hypothetical protein